MTGQTILIIFDGADETICDCGELMMNQGAKVQWVPDVYTAMAQFASGNVPERVIVDVRQLDEFELAFLDLAPRYYPGIHVTIPELDGTAERLSGRSGKFDILTITELNDEFLGIRAAVTAEEPDDAEVVEWASEEPVEEPPPAIEANAGHDAGSGDGAASQPELRDDRVPGDDGLSAAPEESAEDDPFAAIGLEEEAESVEFDDDDLPEGYADLADDESSPVDTVRPAGSRLSTDGRQNEIESGPPLHEAVRQRMAGSQATPSRRVPPGGYPLGGGPAPAAGGRSDESVTPEELDALLRNDRESGLRGLGGEA